MSNYNKITMARLENECGLSLEVQVKIRLCKNSNCYITKDFHLQWNNEKCGYNCYDDFYPADYIHNLPIVDISTPYGEKIVITVQG